MYQLFQYLFQLASILAKRKAFSEALPYAYQAYGVAPVNGLNGHDAAQLYAEVLYAVGHYTEAEKVSRHRQSTDIYYLFTCSKHMPVCRLAT